MSTSTRPPLDGYRVIDLSVGIAGAYCTKLLADGGAEVIKVEPPQGDPMRKWSASGSPVDTTAGGALFNYLACTKKSVVVDPADDADLDALLTEGDAVIWSRDSPFAGTLSPSAIAAAHPRLVVTAITPFGLDGPWSDRPATEFTIQAWSGGIVGLGRGAPDRAPVHVGGQIGEWFAGAHASAATLTALRHRKQTGSGQLIDLSMLETEILGLTYHPVSFLEISGRPFRSERMIFVPGVSQAADGMVALGCATAQQWSDLCVMVGHPEWVDPDAPLAITARAFELAPQIYAWIAERTVDEVCELATTFRIPNAHVANGANLTGLPHFDARDSFVKNPALGFSQPGPPYRMSSFDLAPPDPAPLLGEHTDRYRATEDAGVESARTAADHTDQGTTLPLTGLRVLDMTAFWAGPSCTHILALLGAEVIHVESTTRPDGTRMIAGVPFTEDAWWEKSPIFAGLNTNKKGVTVNIQTERGQELLRDLITSCDVLVENYTPRVLEQVGLDYDSVRALNPELIMVRMPGFGLDGPWRDKAAFAYVIEDASGLTWLTGHPEQNPVEPYSIGDPNAGIHALNGLLLALEHRDRTGEGTLVEASMIDAALNVSAEQVIEHSAYGQTLMRAGNRGPAAAPQNLYQAAGTDEFGRDDCWVAIAVATDLQWEALREALDDPQWARDADLATADGRRRHHDLIDDHLGAWCRELDSDTIVERLWAAGVPVAKVMQPHRQTELPPLAARDFFVQVEHPVNPTASHSTIPVRFAGLPTPLEVRPAPTLGQHNAEVFLGIGLSENDIEQLEQDRIIGNSVTF
ncbi:CaiB/BaiF CoA transferase family protein [Gordonia sp. NPDC127522]|uniref:CaiB/BaiF CoA transferase family protein n=1 Tax=Gordonia sp. NPDC127522 TaxID=3345390 RepID=UPI003630F9C6